MFAKKTMTLNIPDREMEWLENHCREKDLTKTTVIRQALKMYSLVNYKISNGHRLISVDRDGKEMQLLALDFGNMQYTPPIERLE